MAPGIELFLWTCFDSDTFRAVRAKLHDEGLRFVRSERVTKCVISQTVLNVN